MKSTRLEITPELEAVFEEYIGDLDGYDADLARETTPVEGEGWPPPDSYPVVEALGVVVNEEWHHRRFAERDLAALEGRS